MNRDCPNLNLGLVSMRDYICAYVVAALVVFLTNACDDRKESTNACDEVTSDSVSAVSSVSAHPEFLSLKKTLDQIHYEVGGIESIHFLLDVKDFTHLLDSSPPGVPIAIAILRDSTVDHTAKCIMVLAMSRIGTEEYRRFFTCVCELYIEGVIDASILYFAYYAPFNDAISASAWRRDDSEVRRMWGRVREAAKKDPIVAEVFDNMFR